MRSADCGSRLQLLVELPRGGVEVEILIPVFIRFVICRRFRFCFLVGLVDESCGLSLIDTFMDNVCSVLSSS